MTVLILCVHIGSDGGGGRKGKKEEERKERGYGCVCVRERGREGGWKVGKV